MVAWANDQKLELGDLQFFAQSLMNQRDALAATPEMQKAFEDAVEVMGGRFHDGCLRLTHIDRNVMPTFSRFQAMVYVVNHHVDSWCRTQEQLLEHAHLPNEVKDAKAEQLLDFAQKTHAELQGVEDAVGKVCAARACNACHSVG